jgi:hypothetical protein
MMGYVYVERLKSAYAVNLRGLSLALLLLCCTGVATKSAPTTSEKSDVTALSGVASTSGVPAPLEPNTDTPSVVGTIDPAEFVSGSSTAKRTPFPRDSQLLETALSQFTRLRAKSKEFVPRFRRTTRAESSRLLAQEFAAQQPEAIGRELDIVLGAWELLPMGFSTQQALVTRFEQQPPAVYLISQRQIAIPFEVSDDTLPSSVLHEVVHAYQDVQFHLGARLVYKAGQSDRISAYHAFAEGDALTVELLAQASNDESRMPTAESLATQFEKSLESSGLPDIISRSLISPYLDGYRFVNYLKNQGGFALVDRVWKRGLAGTQEVLHPERWVQQFLEGTCPSVVEPPTLRTPNPLSSSSPLVYSEALGEQGLRILLEQRERKESARLLSAVYRTDRLSVFGQGTSREILWQLRLTRPSATLGLELAKVLSSSPVGSANCFGSAHSFSTVVCSGSDLVVATSVRLDTLTTNHSTTACSALRRWAHTVLSK